MLSIKSIGLSEFIAIDLETSGLDPNKDKIIEISVYKFCNGKPINSFTKLINPEIQINSTTTQITGITNQMLVNQPIFDDIKNEFLLFIDDLPIVGHNIMFDLSFLKVNIKNYHNVFNGRMVCDTFYLSKIYAYHLSSFSLSSLCKSFNIPIFDAHRAEEDAKNSGLLLVELSKNILKTNLYTAQRIDVCISSYNVPNKKLFKNIIKCLIDENDNVELEEVDENKMKNFSSYYNYKKSINGNITIDDLFSENGLLSKHFDSFEVREQQIKFCKDIYENCHNNLTMVSEAGAGLGKSYAYLFAALLYSKNNSSQIIISTNTHNLQNQLFYKDIPFVLDILKQNCRTTIIKGMNNYICLTRLEEIISEIANKLNHLEALEIASLMIWINETLTGDISECNGFNKRHFGHLWLLINSKSDYCLTHRCNKSNGCYYKKIRNLALDSDILIVNHSMLVSYYDTSDSFINNDSICIVDECHNFHSICQKQLTQSINHQLFKEYKHNYLSILDDLKNNNFSNQLITDGREIIVNFDNLYKIFSDLCYDIFQNHVQAPFSSEYEQVISINNSSLFLNDKKKSKDLLLIFSESIDSLKNYKVLVSNHKDNSFAKYILLNIDVLIKNMEKNHSILIEIINQKNDYISWFSYIYNNNSLQKISLNSSPETLNEITPSIFEKFKSKIFCSATLSTDSGFDFFIRQMGMQDLIYQDNIKLSKYSSPYYYQDQSKLFIINSESNLNDRDHIKKVANDIIEISLSTNKRILVLCTSFKQIYDFRDYISLSPEVKDRCLFQSKGISKSILLSEYLDNDNSILFGTNTFWEGIDLPNDKLEILLIFKLPFTNPSNPYVKSNIEYYQSKNLDAFTAYQLQDTILKLRQGFGRLIRSYNDMGICIITDPRITKRRYGMHIINSLPVEPIYYSSPFSIIESAKNFLK